MYMRRITVSRLRFCSVTYSSAHAVFLQAIALCVFAVTVEAAPPLRQKSFCKIFLASAVVDLIVLLHSVPHAPRSACISEPAMGRVCVALRCRAAVTFRHLRQSKLRQVFLALLVLLASPRVDGGVSRNVAQSATYHARLAALITHRVAARQLITVLRGRANRCKTARIIV